MPIAPENPYASALIDCGVDLAAVDIEWDDLCHEDVFTFSCPSLSPVDLGKLAELYLTFPSRFVFVSELQQEFDGAVRDTLAIRKAEYGS